MTYVYRGYMRPAKKEQKLTDLKNWPEINSSINSAGNRELRLDFGGGFLGN